MGTNDKKANELKMIFSLISLLLMLPQLMSPTGNGYYRTLFVFLINRVIDMVIKEQDINSLFFRIWSLLNKWFGVFACALAFSLITPDFFAIFAKYKLILNGALFAVSVSCVLRELFILINLSINEEKVKQRIQKNSKI